VRFGPGIPFGVGAHLSPRLGNFLGSTDLRKEALGLVCGYDYLRRDFALL
jgi:hypothetical protein